ncbi:hypothetical protein LJC45_00255 [Alistipes sp. OttesenSCG-928-B03]|nr:hypothetical protein [Alistipes sp. OttesenSCG-928-B03]
MKNTLSIKRTVSRKFLLFALLPALMLPACHNEDLLAPDNAGLEKVSFFLGFDVAIEQGTDYEPITRAANTRVRIANAYNYIIIEKRPLDNKYMVVATGQNKINSATILGRIYIDPSTSYESELVTLRPGNYEILVFNNIPFTRFNTEIKPGMILPDKGTSQGDIFAIQYDKNNYYATFEQKVLFQEAFFGRAPFTVTKTTDLHTSNANKVNVTLERRVSKFRLVLYDDPSMTPTLQDLQTNYSEIDHFYLKMHFKMTGGGNFPVGLDVWGDLWYDPNPIEPLATFFYAATPKLHQGVDGKDYFITKDGDLSYSPYLFAAPGQSYSITSEPIIDGEIDSNQLFLLQYNGSSHQFTVKVNEITGMALKLNGLTSPNNTTYMLEPVLDGANLLDPADLFLTNFEHN